MDKAQEEFGNAGEGAGMIRRKIVENSLENGEKTDNEDNGGSLEGDNLESLKESLNNVEQ